MATFTDPTNESGQWYDRLQLTFEKVFISTLSAMLYISKKLMETKKTKKATRIVCSRETIIRIISVIPQFHWWDHFDLDYFLILDFLQEKNLGSTGAVHSNAPKAKLVGEKISLDEQRSSSGTWGERVYELWKKVQATQENYRAVVKLCRQKK